MSRETTSDEVIELGAFAAEDLDRTGVCVGWYDGDMVVVKRVD